MLLSLSLQLPGKLLALKQVPVQLAHGIVRRKQLTRCAFLSPICGHSSRLYHNEDSGAGSGAGGSRILGAPPKAPFYKCFSSSLKKEDFQVKSVEGAEILQNVLQKNKQLLQEKKAVLIQDIRERKEKVKERVEEVIERENVATIPNLLCVGRIALSPYLGYVIVQSDFACAGREEELLVVAGRYRPESRWPDRAQLAEPGESAGFVFGPAGGQDSARFARHFDELRGDDAAAWLSGMILFRDAFLIGAGFVIRYISLPQPRTLSRYFDVTHATAQLAPTFVNKVNTAVQAGHGRNHAKAPVWNYVDHACLHAL
ncbi:hypothetical protein quinque_014629 [Culex quinquefasciatus]